MKRLTLAAVFATLLTFVFTSTAALADPITQEFSYQVWGDVGASAGVPIGNFSFEGVPPIDNGGGQGNEFLAPGSFTLGEFEPRRLPAGSSLSYKDLPFYISMTVAPTGAMPYQDNINIQGVLNGTMTGSTSSTVVATITSVTSSGLLPFPLADLKIDVPQALSPSDPTLLTAEVVALPSPMPIPEPSGLLITVVMAAGPILRRARRRPVHRFRGR